MKAVSFFILFFIAYLSVQARQKYGGLLPVKVHGKWGYINSQGALVIPARFDFALPFEDDKAFTEAVADGRRCVINRQGKVLTDSAYDSYTIVQEEYIMLKRDTLYSLIDQDGRCVLPYAYTAISPERCDYWMVRKNGWCGLTFPSGFSLVPPIYDSIVACGPFILGTYRGKDIAYTVMDSLGRALMPGRCSQFYAVRNTPLYLFEQAGRWGMLSADGRLVSPPYWDNIDAMFSTEALVMTKGGRSALFSSRLMRYITDTAQVMYKTLYVYNRYFRKVTRTGTGLIDNSGKLVIAPQMDDIAYFDDRYFMIRYKGKSGLVDHQGQLTIPASWDRLYPYSSRAIYVCRDKKAGILGLDKHTVIPVSYDTIETNQNIIKAIRDKKICVYETDGSGEVVSQTNYNNVMRLYVKGRYVVPAYANTFTTSRSSSLAGWVNTGSRTATTSANSQEGDWFREPSSSYWSLRNDSGRVVFSAAFAMRDYNSQYAFSVVSAPQSTVVELRDTSNQKYSAHLLGIVSDTDCRLIVPVQYIRLDFYPAGAAGGLIIRALQADGRFSILDGRGKVLLADLLYAGKLVQGKMRIATSGTLTARLPKDGSRHTPVCDVTDLTAPARYTDYSYPIDKHNNLNMYTLDCQWACMDNTGRVSRLGTYNYVADFDNDNAIAEYKGKYGMVAASGDTVVPFLYDHISQGTVQGTSFHTLLSRRSQYCLADRNGHVDESKVYDRVRMYHEGRVWVRKGRTYYLLDTAQQVITQGVYQDIRDFHEGLALVKTRNYWHIMNRQGQWAGYDSFRVAGDFCRGLAYACDGKGLYGYIDTLGRWAISPQYLEATGFCRQGAARVRNARGWYIINTAGQLKNEKPFTAMEDFSEGVAFCKIENLRLLVDSNGKQHRLPAFITHIGAFSEGLAGFTSSYQSGYIDKTSRIVIEGAFSRVDEFHNGLALVKKNKEKQYFLLNKAGNVVFATDTMTGYSEGTAVLGLLPDGATREQIADRHARRWVLTDTNIRLYKPLIDIDRARPFRAGIGWAHTRQGWAVFNRKGLPLEMPLYENVMSSAEGYTGIKLPDAIGWVTTDGQVIAEPDYDRIYPVGTHGLYCVQKGSRIGYISRTGQWIWPVQE